MLVMVEKAWQCYQEKNQKQYAGNQQKPNNYLDDNFDKNLNHNQVKNDKKSQNYQPISGIIGTSPAMQQVFRAIGRLASIPMTVLITGESGTGKELIAHALHQYSPRKNSSFIALNMSAIPHELIESELFGHEKGAFTGAITTRQGRFEQAHGGTLFLDEIGDMPLSTQTRLLRVLANGEFFRVGGQKPIKVDVRIIAATHQPLENLVKLGKFREDLFYRFNVIRLQLPALRERQEDIPLLLDFFMQKLASQMQLPHKTLNADALRYLTDYPWQGNVRELENICRWLMVMTTGNVIQTDDLPNEIINFIQTNNLTNVDNNLNNVQNFQLENLNNLTNIVKKEQENFANSATINLDKENNAINEQTNNSDWQTPLKNWIKSTLAQGEQIALQQAIPMFEQILLKTVLDFTDNHKGKTAELLGWGRNTLTRKYQQLLLNQKDTDNQ